MEIYLGQTKFQSQHWNVAPCFVCLSKNALSKSINSICPFLLEIFRTDCVPRLLWACCSLFCLSQWKKCLKGKYPEHLSIYIGDIQDKQLFKVSIGMLLLFILFIYFFLFQWKMLEENIMKTNSLIMDISRTNWFLKKHSYAATCFICLCEKFLSESIMNICPFVLEILRTIWASRLA